MYINCPSCDRSVEVSDDVESLAAMCPDCGSSIIQPETDRTRTFSGNFDSVAHFELLDEIGRGGFGSVWKARDTKLDRVVAIKVPRNFDLEPRERELFMREARAAAQLQHPNIVGVLEIGTRDKDLYIVSDFVEGSNLKQWLTGFQADSRMVATTIARIADGLQHAHEHGVIHRDLKPANIMMDLDNQPHIMDFGLAKRESGEATMTIEGQIMGTPMYMSPEQAKGKSHTVDRRADIYSLGVILFEMLTGEKPFRGEPRVVMSQIIGTDPPNPRSLKTTVPKDLDTICLKCLEKDPNSRYATANDVALELRRYLKDEPILARPISKLGRFWRIIKRWPVVSGLSASLAIAVVAGAVGITSQWTRANQEWDRAESNKENFSREETLKSQYLYVANMNMAQQAWDKGMIHRVRDLLEMHIPDTNKPDLRTFAWFYYDELSRTAAAIPTIQFGEKISSIAVSPVDQYVAIVGENEKLEVWNPRTRQKTWRGDQDEGSSAKVVRFSPDGEHLLSMGTRWVSVWQSEQLKGRFEKVLQRQSPRPYMTRFSADGRFVILPDGSAMHIYDTQTDSWGQVPQEGRVCDFCAFGPAAVLASIDDGLGNVTVNLVDLQSLESVNRFSQPGSAVRRLLLSRNRKKLVAVSEESCRIYDVDDHGGLSSPLRLRSFPLHNVQLLPLIEDKAFLAVGDHSLTSWSFDEPTQIARMENTNWFSRRGELGGNGRAVVQAQSQSASTSQAILATSGRDSLLHLWESPGLKSKGTLHGHSNTIYGIAVQSSGSIVTGSRDHTVRIWNDLENRNVKRLPAGVKRLWSVAISPDNTTLATAGEDEKVVVWDLSNGRKRNELVSENSVQFVRFSPDGQYIVFGGHDRKINVWDRKNQQLREPVLSGHDGTVNSFGFSSDGMYLASGSNGGQVIVWEMATGKIVRSFKLESGRDVWAIAFSPVSNQVVFGGRDHLVHRWDFLENDVPETLFELDENVTSLNFSIDGNQLSVTSSDGVITICDSGTKPTKRSNRRLVAHSSDAMFTAFSPDGQTLVSGGSEGRLQFWNTRTGLPTVSIQAHEQHIHSIVFSPDGKMIATACWDGTSKVFHIND